MNENPRTVHGPYDTSAAAEVEHVYAMCRLSSDRGLMARINEGLILGALGGAGVQLGDYDRRIAGWLAGWEPEVVQVVIGWIERAAAGPDEQGPAEGPVHLLATPHFVHTECGGSGRTSMIWAEVTCPECLPEFAELAAQSEAQYPDPYAEPIDDEGELAGMWVAGDRVRVLPGTEEYAGQVGTVTGFGLDEVTVLVRLDEAGLPVLFAPSELTPADERDGGA